MMASSVSSYQTHLFHYHHRGSVWGFEVKATSEDDAKARLAKISYARYDGILIATATIPDSFITRVKGVLRWLFG